MNRLNVLALMSTIAGVLVVDEKGASHRPEVPVPPPPPRPERRTEVIIGNLRTRLTDAECRTLGVDPDDRCIGRMLAKCACGAQLDSADHRWQGSRKVRLLAAGWGDGSACPKCRAAKEANRG